PTNLAALGETFAIHQGQLPGRTQATGRTWGWVCHRKQPRPLPERLSRQNADRTRRLEWENAHRSCVEKIVPVGPRPRYVHRAEGLRRNHGNRRKDPGRCDGAAWAQGSRILRIHMNGYNSGARTELAPKTR